PTPEVPGAIHINLQTVAVRIGQVDGFADRVIGSTLDTPTLPQQPMDELRQVTALRETERQVVEPERPRWARGGTRLLEEDQERRTEWRCRQRDGYRILSYDLQPQ